MDEPGYLLCADADAPLVVAGSVFDRVCSKCGRRVMIAPSGQACLKVSPLAIICIHCYMLQNPSGDEVIPAGNEADMLREAKTTRLNMRRRRN